MGAFDRSIVGLSDHHTLLLLLAVSVLLGLRHATDPDHLTAVSTLIASRTDDGTRRASMLGLAWGLGHAATLCAFGLPAVLLKDRLPDPLQHAAELLVGVVIAVLALRLLIRWRAGRFHAHLHRHGEVAHRHLHPHEHGSHDHLHQPQRRLGRSPRQAFAIGLLHGMGGSAGVAVLLIAAVPNEAQAAAALVVFALCAAVSMTALSTGFGYALSRGVALRGTLRLAPGMGLAALAFGVWYALGALSALG